MVNWFRSILEVGLPKSIDFCCDLRRECWKSFVTLSHGCMTIRLSLHFECLKYAL